MSQDSPKSYKVVVTGFGPFQGVPVNESWRAVSGLWDENLPTQIRLITRELPVVYDIVKNEVEKLWTEHNPDVIFEIKVLFISINGATYIFILKLIIHVGVSKFDTQISIEKQAFNLDYNHEDIHKKCPEGQCCVVEAPESLQTQLDVEKLCEFSNKHFQVNSLQGKFFEYL